MVELIFGDMAILWSHPWF